ncbi:MAG: hypothetical protein DRP35_10710 [Candidatus Zixiibacteriota bacterium]|nr:MAG: hypothetical protein DRP35_10710 [candidate division Zixibacteria bacterium]
MTFSIPPRTAILGIIAGAMGLPKESYHEDMNSENIRIGISVTSKIKKSFHRLNYLMIKSNSDFRGKRKTPIQTPFEIVSGIDPKRDEVRYKIFVSSTEKGKEVFEKIRSVFLSEKFIYNPTMGTANFSARITHIELYTKNEVSMLKVNNELLTLDSACLSENVGKIFFDKADEYRYNMIEEELMPADFKKNGDREIVKMNSVLFTTGNMQLQVYFTGVLYVISRGTLHQTIQFLD